MGDGKRIGGVEMKRGGGREERGEGMGGKRRK